MKTDPNEKPIDGTTGKKKLEAVRMTLVRPKAAGEEQKTLN